MRAYVLCDRCDLRRDTIPNETCPYRLKTAVEIVIIRNFPSLLFGKTRACRHFRERRNQ